MAEEISFNIETTPLDGDEADKFERFRKLKRFLNPTINGVLVMRPSRLPLVVLVVLFVNITIGMVQAQGSPESGSIFYFHYKSEIYRNENASVIILEEANSTFPSESTPRIFQVSAAIRNATTIFGSVWVGSVAWVTQPLTEATTVQGIATFTVWLSSDDVIPSFSGVGAGIAVLDKYNQTVGKYVYTYSYARGKILNSTPTQYSFNVELNLEISAGQKLVFAVGDGSTTEGWHMKIFFDDPQHPSRVQLPSYLTVVPEFPLTLTVLTAFVTMTLSLSLTKCFRSWMNKSKPSQFRNLNMAYEKACGSED